jgi:hypothetical protein
VEVEVLLEPDAIDPARALDVDPAEALGLDDLVAGRVGLRRRNDGLPANAGSTTEPGLGKARHPD